MAGTGTGDDAVALRRLRMRSWRRGMREMDLILGQFADSELSGLAAEDRALFEAMLSENDQDLFAWVTGAEESPPGWRPLVARLRAFHSIGDLPEV